MKKIIVVLILLVLLAGCAIKKDYTPSEEGPGVFKYEKVMTSYYNVYRFVDTQEDVVCYVFYESISCVPRQGR